jgi:hypothetical protein
MPTITSSTVSPVFTPRVSLHGRQLQIGARGNIGGGTTGVALINPCVNATIAVADEITNVRAIAIQLQDAQGADIDFPCPVWLAVMANQAGTAFATGGSTGIAIGTDGAALAITAKKLFLLTSESDGDIDLTWTDTGIESVSLWLILPNGNVVASAPFANV